jgi:hypothetical protein
MKNTKDTGDPESKTPGYINAKHALISPSVP